MKTRAIAAAAKLAFLFLFAQALAAQAADIKVLASPNMWPLLTDIAADFERSTGHKLLVTYDSAATVTSRVAAGEATDVVITLRSLLDALAAQGKAKDIATIGRSFVAVVVRTGAPKPDMSSLDSFKQALLAAPSVVYSDPAKGGLSGIFAAGLIDRMGIADQIKPKLKLVQPGGAALVEAIAKGEAELGIDQLTVVQGKPGVDVVGVIPKEFGADIVMGVGVASDAREPDAAALVKFLTSPSAAPAIKARGMEPG